MRLPTLCWVDGGGSRPLALFEWLLVVNGSSSGFEEVMLRVLSFHDLSLYILSVSFYTSGEEELDTCGQGSM